MMVSNQPYLLRAFYDWIIDSQCTPHLLVDATQPGVNVPAEYVQNGRIVLNVAAQAVEGLNLANEWVTFFARFSGKQTYIEVPIHAVQGIYAKENGDGIAFQASSDEAGEIKGMGMDSKNSEQDFRKKPSLTVVK